MENMIKLRSPSKFFQMVTKDFTVLTGKEFSQTTLDQAQAVLTNYTAPRGTVHEAIMGDVYRTEAVTKIAEELHDVLGEIDAEDLRESIMDALRRDEENG